MGGWELYEPLASGVQGDWGVARREAHYREAAERALIWRPRVDDDVSPADYARVFVEEDAAIGERLGGPVLQRVLQWGTEPAPYCVLELIEGVPVRRVLRGGPAPPAAAVRVGLALADELARVHALRSDDGGELRVRGVPLCADRVWLTPQGVRAANPFAWRTTMHVRAARATELDFVVPEALKDGRIGAEADVYVTALLTLALLIGRSPLLREGMIETLWAVRRGEIAPALFDALPAGLGEVLRRALDTDPKKRPFGPGHLAAELRAAMPDAERADLAPLVDGLAPEICGVPATER